LILKFVKTNNYYESSFGNMFENDSIYILNLQEMIYLTRRERFNAAHRLFREDWSDERNLEIFGACSNPNWHGHNYNLYITVKGEIDPNMGYVTDLKKLSRLIREKVINKLDHKNINLEVEFMQGKVASTENMVLGIWNALADNVKDLGVELHKIRLEETENNAVEYYGT
jgi:6-pyruvoyltetrahydropterin/6-carboxytetrahydropterin synthase